MASRTKNIYRDLSLFERIQGGNAAYTELSQSGYSRNLGLLTLALGAALSGLVAVILQVQGNTDWPTRLLAWALTGFAGALLISLLVRVFERLRATLTALLHRPPGLQIEDDGIYQQSRKGDPVSLRWEDIRVVQHRKSMHLVRGKDRDRQVEISRRLRGHETLAAFLKFAFLLRQETGKEWAGLLKTVAMRLNGSGFRFTYDRDRKDAVTIDHKGIQRELPGGETSSMSWDLLEESIFDAGRHSLRFRHTGTKSSLVIPRGTDSDQVVEEFIRWGLHTGGTFATPPI